MEELMLPTPFVQQSTSQRPLTNLDTAHPSQSLFEGAHSFRMRDFNVISTVPQPHTELVDGVSEFCGYLSRDKY
jgi:hypothetical protein